MIVNDEDLLSPYRRRSRRSRTERVMMKRGVATSKKVYVSKSLRSLALDRRTRTEHCIGSVFAGYTSVHRYRKSLRGAGCLVQDSTYELGISPLTKRYGTKMSIQL